MRLHQQRGYEKVMSIKISKQITWITLLIIFIFTGCTKTISTQSDTVLQSSDVNTTTVTSLEQETTVSENILIGPIRPENAHLTDGTSPDNAIELLKVTDDIWTHVSYATIQESLVPSNGLIIVGEKGLVLVDTPWNDAQMERLIDFCITTFQVPITQAIITHAHDDRLGGIQTLLKHGIPVHALSVVVEQADKLGYQLPDVIEPMPETDLVLEGIQLTLFYPGPAHTDDNTVIWFDQAKLLFAGCMAKELGAPAFRDIKTNVLYNWHNSLEIVTERFPDIEFVVPGHGKWGTVELLEYTSELTDPQ